MLNWSTEPLTNLLGEKLTVAIPELVGNERLLTALGNGVMKEFILPTIQRQAENQPDRYFDLYIEPFNDLGSGMILFTLVDTSRQTNQEQNLQQQRNDLRLLSSHLNNSNEKLAYLLRHFVPRSVAQELIQAPHLPSLGGEKKGETTVLFADMRGFTAVAEALEPEETLDILNRYIDVIAQSIHAHDGSVIQVVGDMVMASFNMPTPQEDHALQAALAALDIRTRLNKFVVEEKPDYVPNMRFGIGINTGVATSGYLGAKDRYRYAVVGDVTNVAFHLCSRATADQIILSETTYNLIKDDVEVSCLGNVFLKSRHKEMQTYELVDVCGDDRPFADVSYKDAVF